MERGKKSMKRWTKIISFSIAMLLVLSLFLVGCGNSEEKDAQKDDNAGGKGKPEEVTYWYPHGGATDKAAIEKAIKLFNEQNPEIKVVGEFVGGSGSGSGITDKLTTSISGGNPPDVVLFDRFMVGQWASEGLFEDMTDMAQSEGVTADQFYDFAWEEASYDGKVYAMPFDTDTRLLFYNKQMFKDAGLDPEKPPKTIEELDKDAEKLTVKEGNRYKVLGFIPWMNQGWLYTWGWSFGGQFQDATSGKITANDPKVVEALEWMTTYAKKYDIEAITNFSTAAGGDVNPFAAKMVAMTISGPWEIAGFKETAPDLDYGVTYIPTPSGSDFKSWAGGWCHVIPKGAKHKEAAMKFAKFMATGEGAKIYGEDTGHFMSMKELNDQFTWAKEDPKYKLFIEMFPNSYCRPAISKGQLLWDELATATDNALHGKGTPKELLDKVTDKVNKELGK